MLIRTPQGIGARPGPPSRQHFEVAAELAGDGLLIVDRDHKVVYHSRSATELLGLRTSRLMNRQVEELILPENLSLFRDLAARAEAEVGRKVRGILSIQPDWVEPLEVEITFMVPSGSEDLFLRIQDLATSRLAAKELEKSRQFLRKMLVDSADGTIVADVSGNVMLFNAAATDILGWPEEEVIGRMTLDDLFDPGWNMEIQRLLRQNDEKYGSAGILHGLDVTIASRSGQRIPVSLSMYLIVENEREVALVGILSDLRDRMAMEKELEETRDYLNNVLENAFDMIITTDLNTDIVSFNRGGERMLGYSRKDVLGKSVEMFWPNPEERRALMRRVEHFDGAVSNFETKLRHKNGGLVDISLTLSLLTDNEGRVVGTVGISKDITDRKRAEAELRATKDYLFAILENTPDMIITTDLEKKIVSFNRGAEVMLGYSREEVLGRNIEDLYVDPCERQMLAGILAEVEGSVNFEVQLRAKEGRVVDIDLTLSHLMDNRGEIIGTVGISKDITEKKRVEAELEQKKAELEAAHLQILHNEKLASLGKLATSVAHEINNPLGGILLFSEMILESLQEDDPVRPDIVQIREQTFRCKEIVKGLLEFGRMTGRKFAFIDLNRTVDQGLALFANQAIFQNIDIVKDLDPHLPQIMGDASQLNQVFTNLIVNAVDAMEGHGTLTIRTAVDPGKEEVFVRFSDTGCGIDPEIQERLFEPFFTTKPVGEGVGLGLSTSYGIVKKHGGRIQVESIQGQGSVFTVFIPLELPEQEE